MSYSYAERLSLTAFLNALLNEWHDYEKNGNEIIIRSVSGDLVLPLKQDSLVQRFSFEFPAKIRKQNNEESIVYKEVIEFICGHPSITQGYSVEQINQFKAQVLASHAHMEDVAKHRIEPVSCAGFIAAEQSLVGGHNLHPASKTHEGWDQQQAQVYSPDYAGEFALHWYLVKAELLSGESAFAKDDDVNLSLAKLLVQSYKDAGIELEVPAGFFPYPVHPHQAQVLRNNTSMQQYIADGLIIELNEQGRPWRATSSTRALWQQDSRWMLKFSLAVKLTNSIRHLSPTELSRGVLFQQVSNELSGAEFKQRFPNFNVLQEPAWCGLCDLAGELILDSLFCWRENPFTSGAEPCVTLATMTQESDNGSNPIAELVAGVACAQSLSTATASAIWLERFLECVIKPVAVARGDYGVVMLAHQQNLLVTLQDGLPVGGAFRDCQGTGFTDTALTRFPSLQENKPAYFADSEALNPYFSYYLILNSLNSVIAALSSQLSISESQGLLRICQNFWLQQAQHSFYDKSFYAYLLQAENLKIKGNFFCFLGVKNETELQDPSRIYVDVANPYRQLAVDDEQCIFKPVLNACKEFASGLGLIFKQAKLAAEQGEFTVASCWQQWQLRYRIDNSGGYHLSQARVFDARHAASTGLKLDTKMSAQQWFSVIEHLFAGLGYEDVNAQAITVVQVAQLDWQVLTDAEIPSWASLVSGQVVLNRSDFYQLAGIWSHTSECQEGKSSCQAENGLAHPLRPAQPEGTWFQRYIYPLQRVISFRCADLKRDVATFSHWHNTPAIARMWELAGSFESHQDYLTKQTNDKHSMAVIGYFDGVPFGYFEVYWTPEDRLGPYYDCQPYDRGVHMLVGNPLFLGGENFINWAAAVEHAVFVDELRTENIMGEPRADNVHVARITKHIGMAKLKEFDFPHKRAALLCCSRATFFNSIV